MAPTASAWAQAAGQLSIETLFRRPQYRSAVLSPDQKLLAVMVPAKGRSNLAVYDLEKRSAALLTGFASSDVATAFWANNRRILYTTGDQQGIEFRGDGGLFAVDIDGSNAQTLVKPFLTGNAVQFVPRVTSVLRRLPDSPDEVLVTSNDRTIDSLDLYRMNIHSGRKSLVTFSSPGKVLAWRLDGKNQPRAALSLDIRARRWWFSYLPAGESSDWKVAAEWDEQLRDVVIPWAFDPSNPKTLFVASNKGRDTLGLFSFDMGRGQVTEEIYVDDRYDVASFLLVGEPLGEGGQLIFGGTDDAPGALVGLRYQADRVKSVWFDKAAAQAQATIDASLPGATNTFDVSAKTALVFSRSDVNPGEFYLFDRERKSLVDTGIRVRPQIDPKRMRPVQPVSWKARDGLRIDGYLALPANWQKGKPVPLILHPHGGPWARDVWSFNPEVQFMASRGFAVLQPNFRGSSGYGAKHFRLSYKQWGGSMIDDMIDGVEWAVAEGFADPKRVAVYGASYGGYATLMAMVKRPDLFVWGVNYVGVTDMAVHQDTQPAQLQGDFGELSQRITGDQRRDAAMFAEASPARHVDRIKAPVFHAYGGEDRNVDYANGRTIRSAFEKADKPFEWMFVADEAHGYRQDENVFAFYKKFEAFAAKHTPPAG